MLLRLGLMWAPRCFRGPLIVLPYLMILGILWWSALLPRPLGLRLLTPLLSQVVARLQVPKLFILTLLYPSAEPGIFVLLLTLIFR